MMLGVLIGASPAGAQDAPPVGAPAFCGPISELLDNNGFGLYLESEDEFRGQVDESARLLVELRRVAPAELNEPLDAVEAFWSAVGGEVSAAGGVDALSTAQIDDLSDRAFDVIEPIEDFSGQSCPGANIEATLYPECETDDGIEPPFLEVGNFSGDSVEVTAGAIEFTVEADDYDYRDVPAELRAEDVLIDGVAGLVETGGCEVDFEGNVFEGLFTATFTSGCPADSPPGLARLKVGFTDDGAALFNDELGLVDDGPLSFPLEVDDDLVLLRLPTGLDLGLAADATAPVVKILDQEIPVELREATCSPVPPGVVKAAPLAPKFTG